MKVQSLSVAVPSESMPPPRPPPLTSEAELAVKVQSLIAAVPASRYTPPPMPPLASVSVFTAAFSVKVQPVSVTVTEPIAPKPPPKPDEELPATEQPVKVAVALLVNTPPPKATALESETEFPVTVQLVSVTLPL